MKTVIENNPIVIIWVEGVKVVLGCFLELPGGQNRFLDILGGWVSWTELGFNLHAVSAPISVTVFQRFQIL